MIVFYNPHVDDFLAEPPHFRLLKRRPLKKYGYLIEGVIAARGQVHILVDGTISAFIPDRYFALLPGFIRRWVATLEVRRWERINYLSGKVSLVQDTSKAAEEILFAFSYKTATGNFEGRLPNLAAFRSKIFHLSHYFISTGEKGQNLRRVENVWLAGDSDISANPYFRRFFAWYDQPFVALPFAVAPRFQVRRTFGERESLCVAIGTFHNLHEEIPAEKYRDYIDFFRSSTYHPVRKLIHDHVATLGKWIVSKISLYRGKAEGGGLKRLFKHLSVSQKEYFNIDIVELYNSYRYAIVGEEASGFPALGAFEAMACGCVLIAQPQFYAGWELMPGKHFVTHDGSLESIVSAIEMLNANPEKAAAIAEAGTIFVNQNLRATQAYSRFVKCVERCRYRV